MVLFPYSRAPVLLFSQDLPLFLSKIPLFSINVCCTVPFLVDRWQIALQFTRSHKSNSIQAHSHTRTQMLGGKDWEGSFFFDSSWAECTRACPWLGPTIFVYACTRPAECSQFSLPLFRNILYSLKFVLFQNYSGNNTLIRPSGKVRNLRVAKS